MIIFISYFTSFLSLQILHKDYTLKICVKRTPLLMPFKQCFRRTHTHTVPYRTVPYHTISYHIISYPILSYHMSYLIIHISSHISYHTMSFTYVISYLITSHHFTSHYITFIFNSISCWFIIHPYYVITCHIFHPVKATIKGPRWCGINTLRPRQNGRHFADDILKCIFLNENVWIPIEISLKFVPKGPIDNIPALV